MKKYKFIWTVKSECGPVRRKNEDSIFPLESGSSGTSIVITAGYPLGKWGVAKRNPVDEVTYLNTWGNETNWNIEEPLWNY